MNIDVKIPEETISQITSSLLSIVSNKKESPQEVEYADLSGSSQTLAKNALEFVQKGEFDAAISSLDALLSDEPKYTKGRVLTMRAFKNKGWNEVALFVGGVAFGSTDNSEIKSIVASTAAMICFGAYKTEGRSELAEQALEFSEMALSEDPNDLVARWNKIEILKAGDWRAVDISRELQCLINTCEESPGVWNSELRMLLDDWNNVIGDTSEFDSYKEELYKNSLETKREEDKPKVLIRATWRKTIKIAMIAAMLSGTPAVIANSTAAATEAFIEHPQDNTTHADDGDTSEIDETLDAEQDLENISDILDASIDYGKDKLLTLVSIDYESRKLL